MNEPKDIRLEHTPDGSHMDCLLVDSGGALSADNALSLELVLKSNALELSARLRLLGFYFNLVESGAHSEPLHGIPAAELRHEHLLWMIDNRPSDYVCGMPVAIAHHIGEKYSEIKEHWLAQVKRQPQNPTILRHAAMFFTQQEEELAQDLFLQADEIDPHNSDW